MITNLSAHYVSFGEEVIVPIFVCTVMPCVIVWLCMWAKRHAIDKKAEIALKALEMGVDLGPDFFNDPKKKTKTPHTIKEKLFTKFVVGLTLFIAGTVQLIVIASSGQQLIIRNVDCFWGCLATSVGAALIVVYLIGLKYYKKELETESQHSEEKDKES